MFVFLDEREDSINDGYFASDLENQRGQQTLVDFPGSYHHGTANLTFADGHAESQRWRDPQTNPPLNAKIMGKDKDTLVYQTRNGVTDTFLIECR